VRLGKHAAQIARRLGDRDLLAYVLNDIGEGLVTVEQIEHGIAALDEAHELWLASKNTPMLIDNRCNLSYAFFVSGQFQPAKILAHEAHALSERTHNLWGIVYSAVLFGYICRETGESAVAIEALHEAFHLGQQSGFGLALWFTPTMLALISLDLGDAARAFDYARAGENSVSTGFLYAKGFITAAYLLASIALADFRRAEAVRPEAEAFLFADEMYSRSQVTYALAEFALTQADHVRALAIANEMLESLRPGTVTVSVPWLLFQKARALLGLSRHAEARVALEQARQIAVGSEQRTILWRILTALADLTLDAGEAQSWREQARELVNFIVAHTPDELRATFLARPDVQTLLATVEVSP
jgi:tetratricopeptide (TPR) repeat protein